jgi:flagellar hook assembly protein FlgD
VQFEGGTPNPFVGKTTFRFSLPRAMSVHIGIYDVRGRLVRELARSQRETAGWHTISWDGLATTHEKVADGAYFARLETAEGRQVQRVVLSR